MDSEITLYLLRHGRSRADDEGVHEGRYDSPLTETGRAQLATRAAEWKAAGLELDGIVASPLARARESAEIVAAALGVKMETDPDWMEIDNGALARLTYAEADARYPRAAFRSPFEPMAGTGESDWDLHARAIRALQRVVRRGPGRYLVVAHGGILNACLRVIAGARPAVNHSVGVWFAFGDAGYARATYAPGRDQWVLHELRS